MDVVVIGAGAFGTWTAHHLHVRGARVTLVDAYGPAHSRSSSGDETRIVRCGYGPDAIYSEMARRSREQWRALDERLAQPKAGQTAGGIDAFWHESGVLWMAAGPDPYTLTTRETLTGLGMAPDLLTAADLRRRFPLFNTDGIEAALLERGSGVVSARRAVRALARDLAGHGVRLSTCRVQAPSGRRVRALGTDHGSELTADHFVFACGAWLPGLFPALLHNRIRPTRQVVTYFGAPAGDQQYGPSRMPAWIDFPAGIYGTPDIDGRGVKVGIDDHGGAIDPDADDRLPDPASLERARAWLAHRIPALAAAPIVEARVCAYENTDTGDFILDRHPDHDNVWIAGGGSGHGFKHGPAIGELVARMVLDGESPDARFALARRTTDARRAVY